MKKILSAIVITLLFRTCAFSQTDFTKALKTCDKFSQSGAIDYSGQRYNLLITLDKTKKSCIYKEKIYQISGQQQLTCNFPFEQLEAIANSMDKFTSAYKNEIAKNKIYEAKLTANGEIFEQYLINPKYCKITRLKSK